MTPNACTSPARNWISTHGGPYILVHGTSAQLWQGIDKLGLPVNDQAFLGIATPDFGQELPVSDYNYACVSNELATIIPGYNEEHLVAFECEANDLGWFGITTDCGRFVSMMAADDEWDVARQCEAALSRELKPSAMQFQLLAPSYVFDAAGRLNDTDLDRIDLNLPSGLYNISTVTTSPSEDRFPPFIVELSRIEE